MRQSLYYSPDGFEWTPYENNPGDRHRSQDRPLGAHVPHGLGPRSGRSTPYSWSSACTGAVPKGKGSSAGPESGHDAMDPGPERPDPGRTGLSGHRVYSMPVMAYEGIYIGLPWIFRTTNTLHYPQLAFSLDGCRFERRYRQPFLQVGNKGDFDESTIYVHQPMVRDGEIRIYYYGGNWRGSEALHAQGDRGHIRRWLGHGSRGRVRLGGCGENPPRSPNDPLPQLRGPPSGGEPGGRQAQPRRGTARGPR